MSNFNQSFTLCIPCVFTDISEKFVREIFEKINIGYISFINIINKTNNKGFNYKCIYINFKHWNNNESAQFAKQRINSGKDIKIVYDNTCILSPYFWKVTLDNRQIARPFYNFARKHVNIFA